VPDEDPSGLGTFDLPLRLPGQYFDKEIGRSQNGFREYSSEQGRYMQSDPIGLGAGLNTYAYVDSNPLRITDALGLMGQGNYKGAVSGPMKTTSGQAADVRVFGCMLGCMRSSIFGNSAPQVSLEPTLGGGIEICEPKPEPKSCPAPKPKKNCGIYDPNCDNQLQPPSVPLPKRVGYIMGVSIQNDGRFCIQAGLFGSAPLPSGVDPLQWTV